MAVLGLGEENKLPHYENPSVAIMNLITSRCVDELLFCSAELSLCLRGRVIPLAIVRTTAALPVLDPLLLRLKQDV